MSIPNRTISLNEYFEREFQEKLTNRFIKQSGRPPVVLPQFLKLIELKKDRDIEVVNSGSLATPNIENQHIYINNGFEC